jgi:anti-anti-sigma regulatory factor
VVDLRELTFADTSLMLDLAMVARRLRRGGRLMVIQEPQPQVWRIIDMVGLHRLSGVVVDGPAAAEGPEPALA